jgi:hypothetical protein
MSTSIRRRARRRHGAAALLAGLLLAAAPAAQAYVIHGAASCREWASDDYDRGWALGYISGYNAAGSTELSKGMKADDIVRRVAEVCRAEPDLDFDDALQKFLESLRARAAEPPRPAARGAAPAAPTYRARGITDLKLDIARMSGQRVAVRARLMLVGGMAMLTDPRQPFDTNPVMADTETLPREDRQFILTQCSTGCEITARGVVGEVMLQPGLRLQSLQR